MSYGKAVRDELRVPTRELRRAIPQVYAGYKERHCLGLEMNAGADGQAVERARLPELRRDRPQQPVCGLRNSIGEDQFRPHPPHA